jgi:hypothetical protein
MESTGKYYNWCKDPCRNVKMRTIKDCGNACCDGEFSVGEPKLRGICDSNIVSLCQDVDAKFLVPWLWRLHILNKVPIHSATLCACFCIGANWYHFIAWAVGVDIWKSQHKHSICRKFLRLWKCGKAVWFSCGYVLKLQKILVSDFACERSIYTHTLQTISVLILPGASGVTIHILCSCAVTKGLLLRWSPI